MGLFYQWGRKDPFIGNSAIGTAAEAPHTGSFNDITRIQAGSSNDEVIASATKFPMTFIKGGSFDWLPDGQSGATGLWYDDSTTNHKTESDPCPPGYKVPAGSQDNSTPEGRGFYGKAFNTDYELGWNQDTSNSIFYVEGTYYYEITITGNASAYSDMHVPLPNGSFAYYPVAGFMNEDGSRASINIMIWTDYHEAAGPGWTGAHSGCLDVNTSGTFRVNWTSGRAAGKPVRCQKIP